MDSADIVDDVNALLKLGVGEAYRLEHIKQAYIQNKTIWVTDESYLQRIKAKYLTKLHFDSQTDIDENLEDDPENKDIVHCWKCGKKSPLGANFCIICGSSLFEVGTNHQTTHENISSNLKNPSKTIGLKIPIIIGIPVLILIIIGGAFSLGFFGDAFEKYVSNESIKETVGSKDNTISSKGSGKDATSATRNSKCGTGTIFDPETNSCIIG